MADLFVCLTFDHDNTSSMISRNMLTPTAISRGDFGIPATARILELLRAERIPTTWFIPGHTIDSYPSCVAAVPPCMPSSTTTSAPDFTASATS